MTSSGIEPATFGFVAQHLNHCATHVHVYNLHGSITLSTRTISSCCMKLENNSEFLRKKNSTRTYEEYYTNKRPKYI